MALPTTTKSLLTNTIQDVPMPKGRKVLAFHTPEVIQDTNGNGDDVFNASNITPVDREANHQGYNPGDDLKAGEELNMDDAVDNIQIEAEKARAAVLAKTIERWRSAFSKETTD